MESIKFIDLFAGLGGIRIGVEEGFQNQGMAAKCVFSSEIKPHAIKVYKNHFNESKIHGDITQINTKDIPDFTLLLAGFPCQPFSYAGNRLGFADTRGTMFFEIERILKEKKPEAFLLENVEGLVKHENGKTFKIVLDKLETLGYKVSWNVLNASDFGLAQDRKRVYIVGTLHQTINLNDFPKKNNVFGDIMDHGLPVSNSSFSSSLLSHYPISSLPGKRMSDKRGGENNIHSWDIEMKGEVTEEEKQLLEKIMRERRKKIYAKEYGVEWSDGMPLTEKQISGFFPSENLHEMLLDLTHKGYLSYEYPKKKERGKKIFDESKEKGYTISAGKLSFEFSSILHPRKTVPTITATDAEKMGVIDGGEIRRISLKEMQKLFGYNPDTYNLDMISERDAFNLLGNTVCVPVIKEIAKRIADCFKIP